jgi:hypothetical protein
LGSKLYLVAEWGYWLDFEGEMGEYVNFIDSYDSLKEAKMIVDQLYEEGLRHMKKEKLKESPLTSSISIHQPLKQTRIVCVYFRCLGRDNSKECWGSGAYDAYCFYSQVLKTPNGDVLSEDLLNYLNCKDELTGYFSRIGEKEITVGRRVYFKLPETSESKSGTIVDVKKVIPNLSEDLDPAKMEVTIISDDLHKTIVTEKTFDIGSEGWGMKYAPDATREEIEDVIKRYKELKENPEDPDIIDHLVQVLENLAPFNSRKRQNVPFI